MRDVSGKATTLRTAVAAARLRLSAATIGALRENRIPKGNPLEVAKVAAVQAAKRTDDIIPYCHPVPIDFVGVDFAVGEDSIEVTATVTAIARTGVEMEALTAAAVAALTLYDMMKMLDETMAIGDIRLLSKKGGKSDFRRPSGAGLRAAVVVLSDSRTAGTDRSGTVIEERLRVEGFEVVERVVIRDDRDAIAACLRTYADDMHLDLVMTTGGTGLGPRDSAPEAATSVFEREADGVAEALRAYGRDRTPLAMLSRARAGLRGKTLIVSCPGSPSAVRDALEALFPALHHAFPMIRGEGHPPEAS